LLALDVIVRSREKAKGILMQPRDSPY
jgi:hypothetical protein